MKNHFIFGYEGNKREEVEKIYNSLNLDKITTIIEPFCGTSALSYYISTLHPKKYKYILNDNNKILIELYNILQDKEKIKIFEEKINEKAKNCDTKIKYLNEIKNWRTDPADFYICHKIYKIRHGLYKLDYIYKYIDLNMCPIVKFLQEEDVTIFNLDAIEIIKNNDNKKSLIFIDPPYLLSCNEYYDTLQTKHQNIYEYMHYNEIKKYKCRFVCVIEKNWIIDLLFEKIKNKIEYTKMYQWKKRVTKHLIIRNFENNKPDIVYT